MLKNNNGPSRKARLQSLLQREIATCVLQQLNDPRIGFITITRVEMSEDLQQVKAFYTVFGTPSQRRLAGEALTSARGFVQRAYAPSIKSRLLPTLAFAYDDQEQRRTGMDDLIRQARSTDSDGGAQPSAPSEAPAKPDDI